MAKVTSPLMSLDASGSIAGALTFSKWKGRNYARQLVIPANPQTVGQQESRARMGAGGRMASFLGLGSAAQVSFNEKAPAGQSGAGYWVKQMIARFDASDADYNNVANATVKGYFDTAAASAGIFSVTIPGDTPLEVPAGLILWNGYQAAYDIDPTIADTPAVSATEAEITEFLTQIAAA